MKAKLLGKLATVLLAAFIVSMAHGANTRDSTTVHDAHIKVGEGDLEAAAVLYHKAMQANKTNQEARVGLASVLIESQVKEPYSEHSDVVAAIEDKVAEPAFPAAYFPLTYLSNGALRSNDVSMSRQVLLALKKLQLGENESAIQITQNLQKQYPRHPVPYNLLGLAWQASGDPGRAQAFFQQALAVESNFHPARINLAELELHLGEFVTAHQELNTVLKADNHNRRACLVMAQLYTLEGKPELARKWYSVVSSQL